MKADDRAKLRALVEAATPGPWHVAKDPGAHCFNCEEQLEPYPAMVAWQGASDVGLALVLDDDREKANAELMAAARAAIPELLDEVERLTGHHKPFTWEGGEPFEWEKLDVCCLLATMLKMEQHHAEH